MISYGTHWLPIRKLLMNEEKEGYDENVNIEIGVIFLGSSFQFCQNLKVWISRHLSIDHVIC